MDGVLPEFTGDALICAVGAGARFGLLQAARPGRRSVRPCKALQQRITLLMVPQLIERNSNQEIG